MVVGLVSAYAKRMRPVVASALCALAACSSSGGNGSVSQAGGSSGGTSDGSHGGMSGSVGGSAGESHAGTSGTGAGSGAAGSGAAGSGAVGPTTCLGLQRDATVTPFYRPPDSMMNPYVAGTYQNGQGMLVALGVMGSIRLVAIEPDGTASELLNESEYQRTWSFDPTEVVAFRRSDGVDLLVSDQAGVALIHKQGTKTTIAALDDTNNMDLHVLGFAPTAAGLLALYWKGDRATGTDETLTAVDVTSMQKVTRTFHGDSGLVTVPSSTGAWLTAERLDATSDCQPTGQTVDCGGGSQPTPSSTCTWHLDVWKVTDMAFVTASPLATFDVPATIAARCGDSTPLGLATYSNTIGRGPGIGSHHAAALDQSTQGLGLALQRQITPTMPGVQFESIDPSGTHLIDGTTAPLSGTNSRAWMAVLAGNLFVCGGDQCAMSDASTGTGFRFPFMSGSVSAEGAVLRPDGVALIGAVNGNPLLQELVSCKH